MYYSRYNISTANQHCLKMEHSISSNPEDMELLNEIKMQRRELEKEKVKFRDMSTFGEIYSKSLVAKFSDLNVCQSVLLFVLIKPYPIGFRTTARKGRFQMSNITKKHTVNIKAVITVEDKVVYIQTEDMGEALPVEQFHVFGIARNGMLHLSVLITLKIIFYFLAMSTFGEI